MKLNYNKILLAIWFAGLFGAILLVSGCKAHKPISEFKEEIKLDSISEKVATKEVTEISKAIKDSFAVYIPEVVTGISVDCDSVCNKKYTELLSRFNTYKKSGSNSYNLLYDENSRMLIANIEMEKQISTFQDSIYNLNELLREKKTSTEVAEKKVYPKWLLILAFFGFIQISRWIVGIIRIFM